MSTPNKRTPTTTTNRTNRTTKPNECDQCGSGYECVSVIDGEARRDCGCRVEVVEPDEYVGSDDRDVSIDVDVDVDRPMTLIDRLSESDDGLVARMQLVEIYDAQGQLQDIVPPELADQTDGHRGDQHE